MHWVDGTLYRIGYGKLSVKSCKALCIFHYFSIYIRHMYGADSKMKAFLCKEKDCKVRHYDNEFRVIALATFIQSLTLPQAVSFSS